MDKLTLGWQHTPRIVLNFAWKTAFQLDKITLNTATNPDADVSLPLNIHVFASLNGKTFRYLGDMIANAQKETTYYQVIKLQLADIDVPAKFLRLVIVPKGTMFFTDEVEILSSGKAKALPQGNDLYTEQEIAAFVKKAEIESRNQRFNEVNKQEVKTPNAGLQNGLVLQRYTSPWEDGTLLKVSPLELTTCLNTTEYIAYRLLNNTLGQISTRLNWTGQGSLDIVTYAAKEVKTREFKLIPDAWIPLKRNQSITLDPGESKIIIAALCADESGIFAPVLGFSGNKSYPEASLKIQARDIQSGLSADNRINVNVWAYFNTPFLKNRETAVKTDLLNHYVNTFFVPPQVAVPALINHDLSAFEKYIRHGKDFEKIFLFLNFRTYVQSGQDYFLSESWKSRFLKGYDAVVKLMKSQGIPESSLYLYPFDEVRNNELVQYVEFTKWIKSRREDAKIFLTVFDPAIIPKVKGSADIMQVLDRGKTLSSHSFNDSQLWLYEIMDGSKALPPYKKYRLLGWKAFAYQLKGVGFWAYGDVRGEDRTTAWNDFDGSNADYTVVYDYKSKFIPSRRWEAFKAGIEDYRLLTIYSEKVGMDAARKLCLSVLQEPGNTAKADSVRREIIREL
ncbi:DUF4091 domain-containing protein [Anseongella ginsenosidimutans]|uniref:DUF4091 domain-containing protein n=1 Tax=Anseongella ginsenosidimutans TaxID=496056 RepID=UPI00131520CB|nr:DUF4091 domain-containing protein [Anseongella ginsenosidimutans]